MCPAGQFLVGWEIGSGLSGVNHQSVHFVEPICRDLHVPLEICDDHHDNDADGTADCSDPSCRFSPNCCLVGGRCNPISWP